MAALPYRHYSMLKRDYFTQQQQSSGGGDSIEYTPGMSLGDADMG